LQSVYDEQVAYDRRWDKAGPHNPNGRVRLVHIFRARLWTSNSAPDDLATMTYEKLIQVAEESDVESEMCLV